jgi:hypothetical protein
MGSLSGFAQGIAGLALKERSRGFLSNRVKRVVGRDGEPASHFFCLEWRKLQLAGFGLCKG